MRALQRFFLFVSAWTMLGLSNLSLHAQIRVTNFTPTQGAPGTVITLFGSNLSGVEIVEFGQDRARGTIVVGSVRPTQLQVVVPRGAVTGNLYIATRNEVQSTLTFDEFAVAPLVVEFDPPKGNPGDEIIIHGLNLVNPANPFVAPIVRFNGIAAIGVEPATAQTQLRVRIPPGATSGNVSVTTSAGTHESDVIFYMLPEIRSYAPLAAGAGDKLTLAGTSFTGITNVRFGGIRATFQILSPTNIQTTVPATVSSGNIVVENPYFVSPGIAFNPAPRITQFDPPGAPAGVLVFILGTSLSQTRQVLFNGLAGLNITNLSPTRISAVVPANATVGPITVITPSGTNVSKNPFFATAVVRSISPQSGKSGTSVVVTGQNFSNVTEVAFNGTLAAFQVKSLSNLTAVIPSGAGSGPVTVTTPGGSSAGNISFFIRGDGPEIAGFTPTFGNPGTTVTLTGLGLEGTTNVLFNGTPAKFSAVTDASLSCVVPTNASSGQIEVRTISGSARSTNSFLVGNQADLRITLRASPNPAWLQNSLLVQVDLVNRGPLVASNAQLSIEWPVGLEFASMETTRGSLQRTGRKVTAQIAQLDSSSSLTTTLRLRSTGAGTFRISAAATNSVPDDVGDNNSGAVLVTVNPTLPPLLLNPGFGGDYDISWLETPTNVFLETRVPTSGATWTPHPVDPARSGGFLTVPMTPTDSSRLFRLRAN